MKLPWLDELGQQWYILWAQEGWRRSWWPPLVCGWEMWLFWSCPGVFSRLWCIVCLPLGPDQFPSLQTLSWRGSVPVSMPLVFLGKNPQSFLLAISKGRCLDRRDWISTLPVLLDSLLLDPGKAGPEDVSLLQSALYYRPILVAYYLGLGFLCRLLCLCLTSLCDGLVLWGWGGLGWRDPVLSRLLIWEKNSF